MASRKILITGGAGFVGSQLGHSLHKQGHKVILLDNMSFGHLDNLIINGSTFGRLVVEDIRAPLRKLIAHMSGVDTIYHFAGIAALPVNQADPHFAYDVNVGGTGNILEAARQSGVRRVIFASTSAIYEMTKSASGIFGEEDPVAPNLVYSMTKDAAENLCKAYSTNYGLDIIIVRFFNIYGPHQDFKRLSPPFTSYLATTLAKGQTPVLFNSSTTALRDYVFSADLIALLEAMLVKEKKYNADIFNACSGVGFSAPDIFSMMKKHSGKTIDAIYDSPEKFWAKYPALTESQYPLAPSRITKEVYKMSVGNPAKTEGEFGWTAKTELEDGLKTIYQYTVEHA
ncbi:UDP-glucose 4-epimerase [Stipitochalara longipes BDJ]|nr:UDP-glucose 4-epimerase [Stipitochalara longipes BDJ]